MDRQLRRRSGKKTVYAQSTLERWLFLLCSYSAVACPGVRDAALLYNPAYAYNNRIAFDMKFQCLYYNRVYRELGALSCYRREWQLNWTPFNGNQYASANGLTSLREDDSLILLLQTVKLLKVIGIRWRKTLIAPKRLFGNIEWSSEKVLIRATKKKIHLSHLFALQTSFETAYWARCSKKRTFT